VKEGKPLPYPNLEKIIAGMERYGARTEDIENTILIKQKDN